MFWFGTYLHYHSSMVVVGGVDGCFPTSCMVNEAHAFFNGMGDGFLLTCLVVLTLCAGVCDDLTLLSASSFFGQRRLVAACPCPQFTHFSVRVSLSLHWVDACRPAQYLQLWTSDLQVLAWWPNFWQLKNCRGRLTKGLSRKLPYLRVNLTGCCFPTNIILTICLWVPPVVSLCSIWSSGRLLVLPWLVEVVPRSRKMVRPSRCNPSLLDSLVREGYSFPLLCFSSARRFLDLSSLVIKMALPAPLILLVSSIHGYLR